MYKRILSFCLLALALTTASGKYLGKNKNGVKMYSINLDLPANQRFVDVGKDFKNEV
jgi:hypothetical protein